MNLNTSLYFPPNLNVFWDGGYSKCIREGFINKFVEKCIQKYYKNISAVFMMSDGVIYDEGYVDLIQQYGKPTNAITSSSSYLQISDFISKDFVVIMCLLCTRNFSNKNLLLLPLDDDMFQYGLNNMFKNIPKIDWSNKKSIVFWRGGTSGLDRPSIRMKVVDALFNKLNTDVKLIKWGNWENEKNVPEYHFGERVGIDKHIEYKYILIIDGNMIASNHQWVFGSGCVPIMITHPDNNYWFKKFLKEMYHYVPVKYDLSDLEEKINWLINNDDKAHQIAKNALHFSNTVFTPTFQKMYIEDEIDKIVTLCNENLLDLYFIQKCKTESDIYEHLPTLHYYTSKCDSVIECGVRTIVSSYAFASSLSHKKYNKFTMIDPYKSDQIESFLSLCHSLDVNASFYEGSDLIFPLEKTDLLFIDTWHNYGQLKRELEYWQSSVQKYIIMHDTTVDEWHSDSVRARLDIEKESKESGFTIEEITIGLWPAITEFLHKYPEWKIEKRYTNNNGLTILARVGI